MLGLTLSEPEGRVEGSHKIFFPRMDDQAKITAAIISAISDVNQTLPLSRKMSLDPQALLYGPQGTLDSLTLTLLIVAIEQKVEQDLHKMITLVQYSTDAGPATPFRSIAALTEHILSLMGSKV